MTKLQKAILKTLVYADVFNYPLTPQEIYRWLIKLKTQNSKLKTAIQNSKFIQEKKGFYFLKEKEKLVELRKRRERWSQEKLKIAQRVARWLKIIPTVKMVAITGALAMGNSDKEDDIDFLIVTSKDRLWLTRLFVVFLIEMVARRRRPGDKEVKDKICLNMFLDEAHLKVPEKEQDLFSAHEVLQLKPLWDKDGIYQKFLGSNQWIKGYLPNAIKLKTQNSKLKTQNSKLFPFLILLCNFTFLVFNFSFFEHLAYQLQLAYMKSKRTTEIVDFYRVRFHPKDCRKWVMLEYKKRLKNLGKGTPS